MVFENFAAAQGYLLWGTFVLALVLGAVANKTNFCTMGAVSDWVNMGDTGRMRAWLLAIGVALLGVTVLEAAGLAEPDNAFPPYRMGQLIWAENLLGGLLFGIGMTLGSGCGNKTLIRIGGGNLKSVMVFLVIGAIAYYMVNPIRGDQTLMSLLFIDWIRPLAINLTGPQDLGTLVGGQEGAGTARLVIGLLLALLVMAFVFRSADFRRGFDNILGGLVVGLTVVGAWYVTSNLMLNFESEFEGEMVVSTREFVDPTSTSGWVTIADMGMADEAPVLEGWDASRPNVASQSPQSFTFINPMGQALGYAGGGFERSELVFGVMAVLGVVFGSFLWAVFSKGFRFEWFSSARDFVNHLVGGILMGFGGVLAMGCTIGQAVTGVSTLAIGSIITFFAIVLGSALTMKVQYYRMVYEEASFPAALLTSLVDFHLLPKGLRRLEAV
jgi:uncharacterized membrane protein YedE/YeeE